MVYHLLPAHPLEWPAFLLHTLYDMVGGVSLLANVASHLVSQP